MAKELPYFKFNSSEWISGEVTLEDLTTQGAFINICAYFWFKSGSLTLTEIKRRLKLKQSTLDILIEGNHIKVTEDVIEISFLREQLEERCMLSKKNSENGKMGGAPKGNLNAKNAEKNNPNTTEKQPKTSNIEEEEEEEKNKRRIRIRIRKEEESDKSLSLPERKLIFERSLVFFVEEFSPETVRSFSNYWTEFSEGGKKMRFEMEKVFDRKKRLTTWKQKEKNFAPRGGQNSDHPKIGKLDNVLESAQKQLIKRGLI